MLCWEIMARLWQQHKQPKKSLLPLLQQHILALTKQTNKKTQGGGGGKRQNRSCVCANAGKKSKTKPYFGLLGRSKILSKTGNTHTCEKVDFFLFLFFFVFGIVQFGRQVESIETYDMIVVGVSEEAIDAPRKGRASLMRYCTVQYMDSTI